MARTTCIRFAVIGLFITMFCYIGYLRSVTREPKKPASPLPSASPSPPYRITIWSNDFHISPINDVKHQLASLNVRFIDKSLSGHCHLTKTCARNLKVLNDNNGISPNMETRQQFYEAYKNDSEINEVDAFICFHPAAMCELFMPFNRTLIVIASTRYELGRFGKEDWTTLNKNLQIMASNPRNVIAGNNLYDAEYIRYFTGIKTIVLPSLCDYTKASYHPVRRKPFLITSISGRNFSRPWMKTLNETLKRLKSSATIGYLREVYTGHYEYTQIARHPGIIYVPYQVSVMSLFEQYRMNIPLFFPTLDLLTEWHYTYRVVTERTWDGISGNLRNHSTISGALGPEVPDPNNEFDRDAIRYWLKFSDFYQWPHITYYNSTEDLAIKLTTTNLLEISKNMKIYNENLKKKLHEQWREIVDRIAQR